MSFLFEETPFFAYTIEHFAPMFFFFFLGCFVILYAKSTEDKRIQRRLGVVLGMIPFLAVCFRMLYVYNTGNFSVANDLPLHLCRLLALAAPLVMFYKSRYVLGMFYFWVIAGTLNANLTPDLDQGFPHLSYFNYWMLHSGLVLVAIYAVFVYRLRVTLKDMWNLFWITNLVLIIMHGINFVFSSNYFYTMQKPPVATLLDYMGPWPWYLLSGQAVAFLLMGIAYIPFLFMKKAEGLYQV